MNLEPIVHSEVSQKEEDTYCILTLQYSCLENHTDGGAWQATVHRVAKSQTQLSNLLSLSYVVTKGCSLVAYFVLRNY